MYHATGFGRGLRERSLQAIRASQCIGWTAGSPYRGSACAFFPDALLALAGEVYEGLSDRQIDEIEQVALDRRDFFGERTI